MPGGWASTVQTGSAALWGQHSLSCEGLQKGLKHSDCAHGSRRELTFSLQPRKKSPADIRICPTKGLFLLVSVPKLTSLLSASLLFLVPLTFLSSPLHLVQTQIFSPPCLFHLLLDLVFTSSASAPEGLQLSRRPCLRAPLGLSRPQAGPLHGGDPALWVTGPGNGC